MKKILVVGKNGQVGFDLLHTLRGLGEIIGTDRSTLDLSKPETIIPFLDSIKPDVIVNAAAYTAVDLAEKETELAFLINEKAPHELAKGAKKHNTLFIHYSTDYVFNGKKLAPYTEDDLPDPLNVYGKSKLLGENAVIKEGASSFIFRTSWVYSSRGKNFLLTMLKLAKDRSFLKIVNDQFGAPTYSLNIARTTSEVIKNYLKDRDSLSNLYGIYHLTASGKTTWQGFAEDIFAKHKMMHPESAIPVIEGIPASDYPTPAKRPANSLLSNEKINHALSLNMTDWKDGVTECLNTFQRS